MRMRMMTASAECSCLSSEMQGLGSPGCRLPPHKNSELDDDDDEDEYDDMMMMRIMLTMMMMATMMTLRS